MPKLNLDIFGPGPESEAEPESTVAPASPSPAQAVSVPRTEGHQNTKVKPNLDKRRVRFIPVGFHEEHLHLLEEAVHSLRLRTYWNASKSDIIRALIEQHRNELDTVWLKRHNSE